jgi:hypothetical protein
MYLLERTLLNNVKNIISKNIEKFRNCKKEFNSTVI